MAGWIKSRTHKTEWFTYTADFDKYIIGFLTLRM